MYKKVALINKCSIFVCIQIKKGEMKWMMH